MEANREAILISKVVDRCETPAEWSELAALASNDSGLWPRLCTLLRDDADLRAAVAGAVAVADAVTLPPPRPAVRVPWWSVGGWLAAAAFALLWLAGAAALPPAAGNGRADALADAADRSDDGREGRTALGELPPVLVRSQPTEDGSALRVVTMRRILEERLVRQVFQVDEDESGELRPVQVELARYAQPSDY